MIVAALLAGAAASLLAAAAWLLLCTGWARFRLRRRAGHAAPGPTGWAGDVLVAAVRHLEDSAPGQAVSRALRQAGLGGTATVWSGIAGAAALLLWGVARRWLGLGFPLDAAVAVAGTRFAAQRLLAARIRKRQDALVRQLPELARLLAGSLRAGQTIPQALERAARDMAPPLGDLVRRAHGEISLGLPLEEALHRLADRAGNRETRLLCASIQVQREVGGDLARALDGLSHVLAERHAVLREAAALSAEARAVAGIVPVLSVGGVLLLNVISPGVLDLLRTLPGAALLLVFGGLQALSWFWIRRLAAVTL